MVHLVLMRPSRVSLHIQLYFPWLLSAAKRNPKGATAFKGFDPLIKARE